MPTRFQHRRDTPGNWASKNPVLLAGEPGYEIGTGKFKVGDGVKTWNALSYYSDDAANTATYVTFKNFDGSPVVGKHVEITLTADGTDIDNIRVVTP